MIEMDKARIIGYISAIYSRQREKYDIAPDIDQCLDKVKSSYERDLQLLSMRCVERCPSIVYNVVFKLSSSIVVPEEEITHLLNSISLHEWKVCVKLYRHVGHARLIFDWSESLDQIIFALHASKEVYAYTLFRSVESQGIV